MAGPQAVDSITEHLSIWTASEAGGPSRGLSRAFSGAELVRCREVMLQREGKARKEHHGREEARPQDGT